MSMEALENRKVIAAGKRKKMCSHKNLYMYLLLLPAVVAVFIFCYVPLAGIMMAFKDYDVIKGFAASPWMGLENFKTILSYPQFLKAIVNTLIYSSVLIFGTFPFPILLALMFNELRCKTFKKVVQTISYMPYFLSWISVVGLFYSMLALDGPYNQLMQWIHGPDYEKVNLMLDSKNFLPILFISNLWKTVGWSSVIFLAAIAGIDPTLYEAADMDGCGRLKQIFYITLPGIAPTAIIVLIMNLGSLVSTNFEQVYGFQNVYIQEDTEVINTLIYRQGVTEGEYSLATAFGLMQGLVSITLVFVSNQLAKKFFKISIW